MTHHQPDLFDALAARDAAMASVAANAEESCPDFAERARAFVLDYLRRHGPASGEAITDAALMAGLVPHDPRAFGPVFMQLARSGKIRKVGFCPRRKGHGTSGGNVWGLTGAAAPPPPAHP